MSFRLLFPGKPIIGMIHLPALPGSPLSRDTVDDLVEYALSELMLLEKAGVDAVIVENAGDSPFLKGSLPAYVVATATRIVREVVAHARVKVGVNMLRNACVEALSVAHVTGAHMIRCNIMVGAYATDQGIIEGCAADLLRIKRLLGASTVVLGDVHVKHAHPIYAVPIQYAAQDLAERGGADAIIVSGARSPVPPSVLDIGEVRKSVNKPVLVGSGVTLLNAKELFEASDGLIVGETDFKQGAVWGGRSNAEAYASVVKKCKS
ncbi:MAG: BtpA/SgcQ family protein [Thermoprotei archaeon]